VVDTAQWQLAWFDGTRENAIPAIHIAQGTFDMASQWDLDPDYLEGLITRLQRFAEEDIDRLTKRYSGFVSDEIEAMQYRADALVERLRGGTFAELMVKHREDHGLWGLADSFIE